MKKIERFKEGLRSQDVHAGLRNVDPNSGLVVQYTETTRLIGMAASLAMTIKGQDVIEDAESLKVIASDQLDIDAFAFKDIIGLLEEIGAIYNVQLDGKKIKKFSEKIPLHKDLYEYLGEAWEDRNPDEVEISMLFTIDELAKRPFKYSEFEKSFGLDPKAQEIVLELGNKSELIKTIELSDGDKIFYSPYFTFENPQILSELFSNHPEGDIKSEFEKIKNYQGLPVTDELPVLSDAISRGLLQAPSIEDPSGLERSFAFTPYMVGQDFLIQKKAILEKALAVLACVRCGENFGGFTAISNPEAILEALLDPIRGRKLRPHSSHRRQYRLLHRRGIVRFIPSGSWVQPQLIDTEDNIAAVKMAIELLKYSGEALDSRGIPPDAPKLLMNQGRYVSPIMNVHRNRNKLLLTDSHWEDLVNAASGRIRLE
jgi:hypothetical protein